MSNGVWSESTFGRGVMVALGNNILQSTLHNALSSLAALKEEESNPLLHVYFEPENPRPSSRSQKVQLLNLAQWEDIKELVLEVSFLLVIEL